MMQSEFVNKMLGVKWVNRAHSFDEVDCYGLVMMYYKHVLNIDLSEPDGYADKAPIDECWKAETANPYWKEINHPILSGVVFTSYKGGRPSHVGIYLGEGKVLHCPGQESVPGSVSIHSVRAVERLYGKMTYHIHVDLL